MSAIFPAIHRVPVLWCAWLMAWLMLAGSTSACSRAATEAPDVTRPKAEPAHETPADNNKAEPEHKTPADKAEPAEGTHDRASGAPAQAPGKARFSALSDTAAKARISPHLRAGETLAYKVMAGPFGPSKDTAVVVVERNTNVAAFAVTAPDGGSARIELPPLAEGMLDRVVSVTFEDKDPLPGTEVVITTMQMTGIGPEGAIPRQFQAIVAWDGKRFVRVGSEE